MLKDADIREPLFLFLEENFGKIRIIEEKQIGRSRADVVMITTDSIYGIEIKSDADTYTRLATQVKDYDRNYDYNFIVVGTSHAFHVTEHVPAHWGIITVEEVEGQIDFYFFRMPLSNPKVKLNHQMKILWRPELAMLQEQNGMPKYKAESKDFVIKKIMERLKYPEGKKGRIELKTLKEQISNILFERDYSTVKELLKEYRKGELQKKLEAETDPDKIKEIMEEQIRRAENVPASFTGRRRYRRRRRKKTEE